MTEGGKMTKTSSYFVFEQHEKHRNGKLIDCYRDKNDTISYTVSKKKTELTISICNDSLTSSEELTFSLEGVPRLKEANYIVDEDIERHNHVDYPKTMSKLDFTNYEITGNRIYITVPAMSIIILRLEV